MVRCFRLGTQREELQDFFGTQHDRQGLGFFGRRDGLLPRPSLLQGHFVEEAQGGDGNQDRTGGQLSIVGQVKLVGANLFGAEGLGGSTEVACE
jgi:hypothetical protein